VIKWPLAITPPHQDVKGIFTFNLSFLNGVPKQKPGQFWPGSLSGEIL